RRALRRQPRTAGGDPCPGGGARLPGATGGAPAGAHRHPRAPACDPRAGPSARLQGGRPLRSILTTTRLGRYGQAPLVRASLLAVAVFLARFGGVASRTASSDCSLSTRIDQRARVGSSAARMRALAAAGTEPNRAAS